MTSALYYFYICLQLNLRAANGVVIQAFSPHMLEQQPPSRNTMWLPILVNLAVFLHLLASGPSRLLYSAPI